MPLSLPRQVLVLAAFGCASLATPALAAPPAIVAPATASTGATDTAIPEPPEVIGTAPVFDPSLFAVRHSQLQLHQAFGLATLASMAVTAGLGYWAADLGGGNPVLDGHLLMVGVTTALYVTSATLALTAPPKPLQESTGPWDTVALHKDLAWLHGAGLLGTLTLGLLTNYVGAQYLDYHAVFAYSTLGLMALSAGVIAFGD